MRWVAWYWPKRKHNNHKFRATNAEIPFHAVAPSLLLCNPTENSQIQKVLLQSDTQTSDNPTNYYYKYLWNPICSATESCCDWNVALCSLHSTVHWEHGISSWNNCLPENWEDLFPSNRTKCHRRSHKRNTDIIAGNNNNLMTYMPKLKLTRVDEPCGWQFLLGKCAPYIIMKRKRNRGRERDVHAVVLLKIHRRINLFAMKALLCLGLS